NRILPGRCISAMPSLTSPFGAVCRKCALRLRTPLRYASILERSARSWLDIWAAAPRDKTPKLAKENPAIRAARRSIMAVIWSLAAAVATGNSGTVVNPLFREFRQTAGFGFRREVSHGYPSYTPGRRTAACRTVTRSAGGAGGQG